LNDRASATVRSLKQADSKYRNAHKRFERAYQAAAATCNAIIDAGATPPKVDPYLVYQKHIINLDKANQPSNPTNLQKASSAGDMAVIVVTHLHPYATDCSHLIYMMMLPQVLQTLQMALIPIVGVQPQQRV